MHVNFEVNSCCDWNFRQGGGVNLRVATVRLCKTISAKLEIFAFEDNEVI